MNIFKQTLYTMLGFILLTLSVSATPIRIMPIGDSITEGNMYVTDHEDVNITNYSGEISSQTNPTYRGKLWDLLKAAGYVFGSGDNNIDFVGSKKSGQSYAQDFDADEEGWSGQTSSYVRDHIDALLDLNTPDIVLLHLGTNDPGLYVPIGSYADSQDTYSTVNNIKHILNSLFQKNPNVKVFIARIIKNSRAETWGLPLGENNTLWTTQKLNDKVEEMVAHHTHKNQMKIVNMQNGAGIIYEPAGIDMLPHHGENNNVAEFHPNRHGFAKMAQKWFNAMQNSGWLTGGTPTNGTELIQGGGNENGALNPTQWTKMSLYQDPAIQIYNAIEYIGMVPTKNNAGMYQAIPTQVGKTYKVTATLIGENHWQSPNDFSHGSSYVTVDNSLPSPTNTPAYVSSKVIGATPSTVEITFTATSTTSYISVRGDTAWNYPNVSSISMKEVGGNGGGNPTNDTTPPVIILNGANPQTLNVGDSYSELGATVTDNVDNNLQVQMNSTAVDTTTAGSYEVTYNAQDTAGNQAVTVIRTVVVSTGGTPTNGTELIQGGGNENGALNPTQWTKMSLYQDPAIQTYNAIEYIGMVPTKNNAGMYQAIPTQVGKTYKVTATLIGENHWQSPNDFSHGSSYVTVDNSLPSPTNTPAYVSSKVIGATPSTVEITFTATSTTSYISVRGDTAWNYPNVSSISMKKVGGNGGGNPIGDTTPPVITLKGANPQTLNVGNSYAELGATAIDNVDGDISTAIIIDSSAVNTSKVGSYLVSYDVKDSNNNSAHMTRAVHVIAKVESGLPWSHGNLQVASDRSTLQYPDGKEFFWMADTAWNLAYKTNADIDLYMNDRASKKFTVIQAVALHNQWSSFNGENPFLAEDLSQPNAVYWRHVDYLVKKAEEKGMYVALLPVWHGAISNGMLKNTTDAQIYGTWIANRYKNNPNIIWVLGGDTPIDGSRSGGKSKTEEIAMWNALGDAINSIDSNHLMTFHPLMRIPSVELGNPSWLDFNMLQSGRGPIESSIRAIKNALQVNYAVVDGESLYEDLRYGSVVGDKRRTPLQVRDDAYSQVFAGALGNTYGHDAIFRFWESTADAICGSWICTPRVTWRQALHATGATQMQYVTKLMQSRPLVGRVPDQTLIVGSPNSENGIVATRGHGYGMIYTSHGENINVNMGKVSGAEVKATWYNPLDGRVTNIGTFGNVGTQLFTTPDSSHDWVLVLDDTTKGFSTPGL